MTSAWTLTVLGIAQDGGMPQAGCRCSRCQAARDGRRATERVASIGVALDGGRRAQLFDATPDLAAQLGMLTDGGLPERVWLTHAHVGHYVGLVHLGKEAANAHALPVCGTARMLAFLAANAPWSDLFARGHVEPVELVPGRAVDIGLGLVVTPLAVPPRSGHSDTLGYRLDGPRASALYVPDIDAWDRWDHDLGALADHVDWLLVDGTFASASELPHRALGEVPHPLTGDTRARVRGRRGQLKLIHLNHTNPLLDGDDSDVARQGDRLAI